MLIFVVLSLLLYEALHPGLSASARRLIFYIDAACCGVFLTEFWLRLRCAESKSWFWRHHWIDFVTSIPVPDALLLRSGRLLRVLRAARLSRSLRMLRALRLVRGLRLILFFWRGFDKLYEVLDVRLMRRSVALTLAFLAIGATSIFAIEGRGHPESAVDTPLKAVWWSFTTLVTGGFADIHNPISPVGQATTVVLVLARMTVVGVFTATLTAILVGDESEAIEVLRGDISGRLDALDSRLAQLATSASGESPEPKADKPDV